MLYKFIFQSTLQTCNLNIFVLEKDFEYSSFFSTNFFQILSSTLDYRRMLKSHTHSIQVRKCPQFNVLTIKHTQGFQSDYIERTPILKKLYVLVPFDKDIDNMM